MSARKLALVRDVLDKQLLDRDGNAVGRADGIILVFGASTRPPRVTQIEAGIITLASRLHPRLADGCRALARKWGFRGGRPVRIPWAKVDSIGKELKLDLSAEHSELLLWERWLRDRIIQRIPGSRKK
jgi:hypothetical protein